MKRYIFVALAALTLLFFGFQTAFCQVDTDLRGNTAPSEALPEDLEGLDVKDYFIAPEAEPIGLIQTVTGHVVVLHGETNEAYFAAQGDAVFQQDALFTLEESRCRVRFISEDVITMGEDARIDIEELVDDHELQRKKSTFNMLRGKAMFYVVPLFRHKEISALVKTKTAVAGIRGTKFGVEVRKASGKLAQSEPLYIADASDSGLFYLAQANLNDTETVVYAFEGEVDVYSPIDGTTQKVREGETVVMTTVGAGIVKPTPPAAARQFMKETEAPAPAEEEETAEEGAPAPAVKEAAPAVKEEAAAPVTTDTTDVTQDQTATSVAATASTSTTATRPSTHYGYFSSMLTDIDTSPPMLDNVYAIVRRANFDSTTYVEATGIVGTGGYMRAYPGSGFGSSPYLTKVAINSGTGNVSADLDSTYAISHTELGYNAYQEWGYWTMTANPVEINYYNHYVDNKAFYMFGNVYTPCSVGVSGHYSGTAWGTYWAVGGGTDMTGTFGCDVIVNSASGSVSNFELDVYDSVSVHSASVRGSGVFDPGTSDFSLSSPTCTIDGSTATSGELAGGLYGPNGEYIGGAGGIYNSSSGEGVNLLFQGSK
ncbi:MAG: FecR family protein [Proteobacteria bacterium]|nr:FecR family protein [Pseudomonadota bacterium]MCG2757460.1 FecR family protein [Desulfobacteraceae bacterium]